MPRRACAIVLTLIAAGCGGQSNTPTTPSPAQTPPAPTFSGVKYDNISVSHEFIVGSPVQTQNQANTYCCWPLPVRNPGTYTFNEADFPLNVLPSGGTSNIVSESEMIFVGLNEGLTTGTTTFEWHRAVGEDVVVYTFPATGSYDWAYSFIGHFLWEISQPGSYYVVVSAPSGSARLDFLVTNSTSNRLRVEDKRAARFGGGGGTGHVFRDPGNGEARPTGRPR